MEELINSKGISALVIILGLHLLVNVAKILLRFFVKEQEKEKVNYDYQITKIDLTLTQVNESVRDLRVQLGMLERELADVGKFKSDSQALFSAIKFMAGEDWPSVRKAIDDDRLPE